MDVTPEWVERMVGTMGLAVLLVMFGLLMAWRYVPKVVDALVRYFDAAEKAAESNAKSIETLTQSTVDRTHSHKRTHEVLLEAVKMGMAAAEHSGDPKLMEKLLPHFREIQRIVGP